MDDLYASGWTDAIEAVRAELRGVRIFEQPYAQPNATVAERNTYPRPSPSYFHVVDLDAVWAVLDAQATPAEERHVALTANSARAVRLALARAENALLLGREPHEDAETRSAIERCQEVRAIVEDALSPHGLVPAETHKHD